MNKQLCTVLIDQLLFGIEVELVQEVLRFQGITRVPLAKAEIEGLINLRGQIVTAVDLRRRLGLTPRPADSAPLNVVVRHMESTISFLVDDIGDVIDVDDRDFEPTPETIPMAAKSFVSGIYKLEGTLLLLLNTIKTMQNES